MNKLVQFAKQAVFIVRVITGIEQRRIRAFRLAIDQRAQKALERREALRKVPEQLVLQEVRSMVKEMQKLNNQLDNADAALKNYLKPINAHAQAVVDMRLEEEKNKNKMLLEVMKQQALDDQAEAEIPNASSTQQNSLKDILEALRQQAALKNAEADKSADLPQESEKGTSESSTKTS